jgi:hypothetical protein
MYSLTHLPLLLLSLASLVELGPAVGVIIQIYPECGVCPSRLAGYGTGRSAARQAPQLHAAAGPPGRIAVEPSVRKWPSANPSTVLRDTPKTLGFFALCFVRPHCSVEP